MKKKFDTNYLYLIFIVLFIIYIALDPANLFASKVDWINQHTVFPEYFRNLFYETGKLIPNFAANIGGGQNIFNFSYYGLFNPIILISYLLPGIKMVDYIIYSNIILILASTMLLYYWLKGHIKDNFIAFLSTIITILGASFIFQFHRHFMFVDYMPFLILGLIGIDLYFTKKTKWLYCLSTFLMILVSYYYSIIGIFIFVLYGVFLYIKQNNKITIKNFFKDGFTFLIPIFIGIMMAGLLLLPTGYVILNGRSAGGIKVMLSSLLIPKWNFEAILYDPYSLGLTCIVIFSLIHLLSKKEIHIKFLTLSFILTMIIPLIIYLLNGTLYIRNKVFIPFLPIISLFIAIFIKDLFSHKINIKKLIFITTIIVSLVFICGFHNYFLIIDYLVTVIAIILFNKTNKKAFFIIMILAICITNFFLSNTEELYIPKDVYNNTFNPAYNKLINRTLKNEKELVRFNNLDYALYTINKVYASNYYQTSLYSSTYNNNYKTFYKDVFKNSLSYRNQLVLSENNNIMYDTFMGVKYIITTATPPVGYKKIDTVKKKGANISVYKNDHVMPVMYASNKIMPTKEFDKLNYPLTNEALTSRVIVNNSKATIPFNSHIKQVSPTYKLTGNRNVKITKRNNKYIVDADEDGKIIIRLDEALANEILFINFDLLNSQTCNIADHKIIINGVMNKKTCTEWEYQNNNNTFHYALSRNRHFRNLNITFGKGHYEIENVKLYKLNYDDVVNNIDVDKFINSNKTTGDTIEGTINVRNDGYFITSIPYDKGFKVLVDNKDVSYEMVNKAFVGFKINKGFHTIKITYKAMFLKEGIIVSFIGLTLFIYLVYTSYCKRKTI